MNIPLLRKLWSLSLFAAATIVIEPLTPFMVAATPEEQAVLFPLRELFNGMAERDGGAIKASAIPGATMVLMRYGETEQITFDEFAERIGKGKTKIEERIQDPLVRIDHDLAMVWTSLDFLVDGERDHCGTDLVSIVHRNGKWLIANLAATIRNDCGAK